METLQNFRPALGDLAILKSLPPPEDFELPFPVGQVPVDYFEKRIAAFRLDRAPVTAAGVPEPIRLDDPDLIAAIDVFGLVLP